MKLSTRSRYGTRILVNMSLQGQDILVPLKEISVKQRISLSYVEKLVGVLVAAGFVESRRGVQGGVQLARPASEIKMSDVIRTMEGSTSIVACIEDPQACANSTSCITRCLWTRLSNAMIEVLESTTIQDLAESAEDGNNLPEFLCGEAGKDRTY